MWYNKSTDARYAQSEWDVYWFEKNVFGDIAAIYNSLGVKIVRYSYDAWGEITEHVTAGYETSTALTNSFKYRGYYFDNDLGLYYLNARYYDQNTFRFINADGYVSTGQGLLGNNMFAYCNNNPIMYVDRSGEFPWLILGIFVVTTIAGGLLGAKSDAILGAASNENNPPTVDNSLSKEPSQSLTTAAKVKNIVIGASLGFAAGGAIVATGGVFLGAAKGIGVSYLGVTALQGFAIGALAFDLSAVGILPIFGIEIEPIEYEAPTPPVIP